jgi:xanthine permease XanP
MSKPSSLIYGVNDKPSFVTTIILGFQHIFLLFIAIIFPVIIVREMGVNISEHDGRAFVSLSLLAGGLITILQSVKNARIGSGYLCPSLCGPSYFNASLYAVSLGGLPLLFGMTSFVGIIEALFSRIMHRLRGLFPPEVTGTVVALVGIVVIPLSVRNLVGIGFKDEVIEVPEIVTGIITLAFMVGLNVFSKGKLKLFCTLTGMILGYILAYAFGIMGQESIHQLKNAPLFSVPYIKNMSWSFDIRLVIPFTIAALSSTLKTIGDISTCQRINDSDWKRVDMKTVSGGIFADGMGGILPGLIGGFGQSTSSSNIGLSVATGATSRVIAYSTGLLMIFFAFFPRLANFFIIMPKPVMGALLIFSISFMIVQGLQMIMSRMLDARKIFVVGISLILGLSVDMTPEIYEGIHPYIQPVFSSSLSLGAISAVTLNLLLRLGVKKHAAIMLNVEEPGSEKIFKFMEQKGQLWGARPEIVSKVSFALSETFEMIVLEKLSKLPIKANVSFDELKIEAIMEYAGEPVVLYDNIPDFDKLETSSGQVKQISGFLISQYCDKIKISESKGLVKIRLSFEH